jgi:trehalose 6-phosphate synthase/phosphatase
VPNLWLASESGYEYRVNGQWQTMLKISSKGWLKILKRVMQEYCDNVDGSCVEERNSTIVWNYKNAELEHGHLFAKELCAQITSLIGPNAPIEIVQGTGFLEVKPVQLKKSTLMQIFLKELSEQVYSKIDFLLYIGADSSDEPVFEYLKQQVSAKSKYFSADC